MSELAKPLRYLIGANKVVGTENEVIEVPYGHPYPQHGIGVGYCNLFDEEDSGEFGPYLDDTETAEEYGEAVIDPAGEGWIKNLAQQFKLRKKQGFKYIELDNPDAYDMKDVVGAIDTAQLYGLKVIAKNPWLTNRPTSYVNHPNIYGIITEQGAGGPKEMERLRQDSGKLDLPVWFVAFGQKGKAWTQKISASVKARKNMWVSLSTRGEYENSIDV